MCAVVVSPPAILLPPLSFDEASALVVAHLKRAVPLAFWAVSRYDDDKQVYHCVRDDAYGQVDGMSLPWSDTFCQCMVAGVAPQVAPDAMAVPEYAATRVARDLRIGTYMGVPIRGADDRLFGTICGIDPRRSSERLHEHVPLLHLCAALLGQILRGEHLRAEAADREAKLAWSAFHDDLTGLPNRAMFFDRVARALERHARDGRPVAVLLVDLDGFKAVNDTLGHAAGDDLLVVAAQLLQRAVRPGDTLARLGGDEFAVLLEDVGDPAVVGDRLVEVFANPFAVGGRLLGVSATVGVAVLTDPTGVDVEAVLSRADIAMYSAKRAGKGRFAVYDPAMTLPEAEVLELREPLRCAIATGDVEVHYQPIVDLRTGGTIGFEALARWSHEGRSIGPDVFVPIAARSGLTGALTEHVLDVACRQAARWSVQLGHRQLRVSVNVSPHSIGDPDLPDRVAAHLQRYGLGPGQLALEITEDALLHNPAVATAVAHRLRELGVVLSLDDFGSGYSSLLHLRQIPLHSVKIDRGFAGDIDTNPDTEKFMRALLALGRDLDLRVVVEGVERRGQVDVLRRIGCTHAQGHLFGRPVAAPGVRLPFAATRPATRVG